MNTSNLDDLKIKKIEVPDPEYISEIPPHMKNGNFPGFPSTTLICGPPGKGKTNLLMNLLLNSKMWNKFFDKIYAYGPTVESDKLYKCIKLQPQNVCSDVKKIIPDLEKKLKEQTELVKTNPNGAPKILFLFEDMTSFFNTIQHNENYHRCYTQIRHVKGASVTMVHKYHAFHRTPRVSSQHIVIFETNQKDLGHLYEEFGPRSLGKDEFMLMASYALEPNEQETHPFFYINNTLPERIRYRRCFTQVMEIMPHVLCRGPTEKKPRRKRKKGAESDQRSLSPTGLTYDQREKKERRD